MLDDGGKMEGRRETHNKTDGQDQQDGKVELPIDALVERLLLIISREVVSNVLLHRLLFLEVLKLGGFTGHRRLVDFVGSSHRVMGKDWSRTRDP
jgi:hypothetical protein